MIFGSYPSGAGTPLTMRRRTRNGNFSINQRAVSGTVALAAGAYGHDGWKAGASGCTYTFATAANGDTTLTITAGTLLQIIEGGVYLPEGGRYALSWAGTATGRMYQGTASGSYVASPVAASSLTAGTNVIIEFSTGTLGLVQLEPGINATPYERRDDERTRCERYLCIRYGSTRGKATAASDVFETSIQLPGMYATPGLVSTTAGTRQNIATGGAGLIVVNASLVRHLITAAAAGDFFSIADAGLFSAEL